MSNSEDTPLWQVVIGLIMAVVMIGFVGFLIGISCDDRTFYQNRSIDKAKIQRIDTAKGVDFDTLKIIWYRR